MFKLDQKLITLFFPARCIGCEREILPTRTGTLPGATNSNWIVANSFAAENFDAHWCLDCWRKLATTTPYQCRKCGAGLYQASPFEDRCSHCFEGDLRFEQAVAIGNYRGLLQELVIRMKNQHDEQLSVQLGQMLASEVLAADFLDDLNLVAPVPSHWWRRVRRGFQASEIISEVIAARCNVPYAGQIMTCIRGTKKQGTLSTPGRFKNVRGAFKVHSNLSVTGLTILLVDDVMTSGATVSELARVLIAAGAAKVYVGVIARGAGVS